jgi:hypothetical protein
MREVFPTVLRTRASPRTPWSSGRRGAPRPSACARRPGRARAAAAARRRHRRPLAPGLRGGRVYTDDVAPVEWLIDASIVEVAASGER